MALSACTRRVLWWVRYRDTQHAPCDPSSPASWVPGCGTLAYGTAPLSAALAELDALTGADAALCEPVGGLPPVEFTDAYLLSGASFGTRTLFRFTPHSPSVRPKDGAATGAPATFVMHQGLYVTPVPGGTLLDPNVTSTDTGYWILAP